MFGQTTFISRPDVTAKNSRTQNTARLKRESTACTTAPRRPPSRPAQSEAVSTVAERYTNRAFNRQPSPTARIERAPSPVGWGKERVQSAPHKPRGKQQTLTGEGSLDATERRALLTPRRHERPHSSYQRMLPNTQEREWMTTDRSAAKPSKYDNRILLAVREVLSRAVIERGMIDEHNIGTVLKDMESCITMGQGVEVEQRQESVDEEKIKAKLNLKDSSENIHVRKSIPLAGIVRKDVRSNSKMRLESSYKKIHSRGESDTSDQEPGKKMYDGDSERVVYIDLPDSDCTNFNLMVKKKEDTLKAGLSKQENDPPHIDTTANSIRTLDVKLSKQDSRKHSSCTIPAEMVGDCSSKKGCTCDLWRPLENPELQQYVENLVRSMKKESCHHEEAQDKHNVCKTFCVCRMCVSDNTASERTLHDQPSKNTLASSKDRAKSTNIIATSVSKLRQPKQLVKKESKDSHFRVLKQNKNFQPDSRMSIPRQMVDGPQKTNAKRSYTLVKDGVASEACEDMYLQRRLRVATKQKNRI